MKIIRSALHWGFFFVLSFFIFGFGTKTFAQTVDTVPVVTIQATDPVAITYQPSNSDPSPFEPLGKLGVFTVFRQGSTNLTLNVYYQIGGTASNGVDYATIPNWITIPAGATSNSIPILPLANRPSPSVTKTVVLQLAPSPTLNPVNFEIGVPSNAVVYLETTNPPLLPLLSIGSPTNGAVFYTPTNIEIIASTGFPYGATNVEFFAGTIDLGRGIPYLSGGIIVTFYHLTWTNPPPGDYALTAVGTGGLSKTSAPVNIAVRVGPLPIPPTVNIIEPKDGALFYAPTNIFIGASVGDADGSVASVQFFAGTNSLGFGWQMAIPAAIAIACTNCPPFPNYGQIWTNPPTGTHILTAVVTDNDGTSVTSAPVNITVNPSPAATHGYITAVLRSECTDSPTPPPPVGGTRVGSDYVIMTVADADPTDWTNAQRLVTDAIFESLMPQYCALPKTGCVTDSVQWNIITYGTNGNPITSGCAASGCQLHSCEEVPPPTNLSVSIFVPANGSVFFVSTNVGTGIINVETDIELLAKASDPNGTVTNVEFFAGTNDLGAGTPVVLDPPGVNGVTGPVYFIYWHNPSLGNYILTAEAADDGGLSATSAEVNVTIQPIPSPTNPPSVIRIISPANGAVFRAPINLPLFVFFTYPYAPGDYASVGFYDGTNFLGTAHPVSPPPPPLLPTPGGPVPPTTLTDIYELVWTNAPVGNHVLTAGAGGGNLLNSALWRMVSAPVNITILPSPPPPTNRPAIVSIVATDPVAVEGTNSWIWKGETNSTPTWASWPTAIRCLFTNSGPKNAVFTVHRFGITNNDLTVNYDVGGTASNGVDYVALPGYAIIPAGGRDAVITVVPIDDGPPDVNKTVILALTPSTNNPSGYLPGFPRRAAAIIIDSNVPHPVTGILPDKSFHFVASGPDAAWFCIEYSTDLVNWTPVCTNQVVNGSIDFVDPDAANSPHRFYRILPVLDAP